MASDAEIGAFVDRLIALPECERAEAARAMTPAMRREFLARWKLWAHGGQTMPPGDWRVWLIRAGRGFGKTRAGSEWVNQLALDVPEGRFALVGASLDEVRAAMAWEPTVAADLATTPAPTPEELRLIREELDPEGRYTR